MFNVSSKYIRVKLITIFHSITLLFCFCYNFKKSFAFKPVIITSRKFIDFHIPYQPGHVECPARIDESYKLLEKMKESNLIDISEPLFRKNEAVELIKKVHDPSYVDNIEALCKTGAKSIDPFDVDTYISKNTFNLCVLAQSAWMDGIDFITNTIDPSSSSSSSSSASNKMKDATSSRMAFSVTRPPGHHALHSRAMGFCIFNFAVGAAIYAQSKGYKRIGIIDFDVHYGNGVADLVANSSDIRYTSLHQMNIFPNEGSPEYRGLHDNILNIEVPYACQGENYLRLFQEKAIPFIKEFNPDLVIVCAGYDALASDPLADISLQPKDYNTISTIIKDSFSASTTPVLYGLEGGYDVVNLPLALRESILPFCNS